MRDDERRAALAQAVERTLDVRFRLRVECAGRFIQDQDRRVLQDGACNGEALAFTARQRDAALAYNKAITVRLLHDEVVSLGETRGTLDLRLRRSGAADGNVVSDRSVEQSRILEDDGDLLAQRRQSNIRDVVAVDDDPPGVRGAQPEKKRQRRRFARPGWTYECQCLSRLCLERHVEHALPGAGKAETYVVVSHRALHGRQRRRIRLFNDAIGFICQCEVALQRRRLTVDGGDEAGNLVKLADQEVREADEGYDLADRHLSASGQHGAHGKDCHHGDGRRRALEHGQHAPPRENRILGGEKVGHDALHRLGLVPQARIALHDADVADHVADSAEDGRVVLLDVLLPLHRSAHHEHVHDEVRHGEKAQDSGHARVHADRRWHEEQNARDGRELLAQGAEPKPEQGIRTLNDGADHGTRAAFCMIRLR